jgi:hypothetical protein
MPTCPLCENVQPAGEACDVCGRAFPRGEAIPVPVAPLPEIERTALDLPPGSADGPSSPLDDLEPTSAPGAGAVAVTSVEGLEPTRADAVAVAPESLPDLEPTGEAPIPGDPLALDVGTTCRYCRTPAPLGTAFCARCGMRLPGADAGRGAVAAPPDGACWQCGSPVSRETCPSCGARVRG